jgi:hypothetical protein
VAKIGSSKLAAPGRLEQISSDLSFEKLRLLSAVGTPLGPNRHCPGHGRQQAPYLLAHSTVRVQRIFHYSAEAKVTMPKPDPGAYA